jgi:hypothetical protein
MTYEPFEGGPFAPKMAGTPRRIDEPVPLRMADFLASDQITEAEFVDVTLAKLDYLAVRVINIVLRKNADYGNAWQRNGAPGWAHELQTKLCRLERLMDGREALIADENIKDTLIDAIGYSMLGLLYLEHQEGLSDDSQA